MSFLTTLHRSAQVMGARPKAFSAVALTGAILAGGLALPGAAFADRADRSPACRGVAATHVNEDGGPGNDVIVVTEAGLEVRGWNGDDLICVSPGHGYGARIDGGNGNDSIITYSGENFIFGGAHNDSIMSNTVDHLLDGEDGNDNIYVGAHADFIVYGGDGADKIFGSSSADSIDAGTGNDLVITFGGNDVVQAGAGDDRIEGGAGTDTLDAGPDTDVCVDSPAPSTTFVSCETATGLPLGGGGGLIGG